MTSSNLRTPVAVRPHENGDPAFWKIATLGIVLLKKTCVCDAQKRPFTCTQKAKTGLENIPSSGPGQVAYLPNGQGSEQVTSNKVINKDEQEVAPGKQDGRAAWPKDKLQFKFFSQTMGLESET